MGHGGGAMGWRGGGDQRQQPEVSMKKKKIEKGSRCGLHCGETAPFHCFDFFFFFLNDVSKFVTSYDMSFVQLDT